MAKSPKQAAVANLKATAKAHASAVAAMAQTKADGAIAALAKAVRDVNAATGRVDAEMSRSFAALLASDHALTPKTVSVMIADRIGAEAKAMGSAFSTYRSRNVAFFKETRHLNALRRAVPNPEGMDQAAFDGAVASYLVGLSRSPTQWAKAKGERVKAKAKDDKAEAEANARTPDNETESAVSRAWTRFQQGADETLRLAKEGDTAERAEAKANLQTMFDRMAGHLAAYAEWEAEQAAKAILRAKPLKAA